MFKFASAALLLLSVEGFTVTSSNRLASRVVQSPSTFAPSTSITNNFILNAADKAEAEGDETAEEVVAEVTDDEPKESEVVADAEVEPEADAEVEAAVEEAAAEEEGEVDEAAVELEAIKKEITDLEFKLKNKNRELDSIEKMGEQYTQGGYGRKVAEMEGNKKSRTAASGDKKMTARASVLENFLPVVDELKVLTDKYEGDVFAKKYAALSWDFNNALTDLGVAQYSAEEGDKADGRRVTAVESEHSDTVAKGCVIKALDTGYELEGNVMRLAGAVVSLGPAGESDETEAEPEAEESSE